MNTSKKKMEPGAVLKVIEKGARSKGAPIRFECEGSKLYFASGFQWAVERVNEPIKYLINLKSNLTLYTFTKQEH